MIKDTFYEVQAEIETKCALECIHCSSSSLRKYSKIDYDFTALTNFLKMLDSKIHLYLTGGEPLLLNNLSRNIKTLKDTIPNLSVGIFTCGIGMNRKPISRADANDLKTSGLNDCYISLYHSSPDKHDAITGFSGSYEITCESIKNLLSENIDVKAHLVITRFNFEELKNVISELMNLNISQVRILRLVNTGAAAINWEKIGISYEVQNNIIHDIISNISFYDSKVTISGFPTQIGCRPFPCAQKCQAGINLFYISGDGGIYPCACTKNGQKYLIGCIKKDNAKVAEFIESQKKILFNEDCLNPISD